MSSLAWNNTSTFPDAEITTLCFRTGWSLEWFIQIFSKGKWSICVVDVKCFPVAFHFQQKFACVILIHCFFCSFFVHEVTPIIAHHRTLNNNISAVNWNSFNVVPFQAYTFPFSMVLKWTANMWKQNWPFNKCCFWQQLLVRIKYFKLCINGKVWTLDQPHNAANAIPVYFLHTCSSTKFANVFLFVLYLITYLRKSNADADVVGVGATSELSCWGWGMCSGSSTATFWVLLFSAQHEHTDFHLLHEYKAHHFYPLMLMLLLILMNETGKW